MPTKPDKDRIDLVVYKDDELKQPYIVVECKKNGISNAAFKNAIEQAFRYANYIKAFFAVAIAGNKREIFNTKEFSSGERQDNLISDLPFRYGTPPQFKYYKKEGKDLNNGSRKELIQIFKEWPPYGRPFFGKVVKKILYMLLRKCQNYYFVN